MARRSQHTPQQLREMIIDAAHSLIESGGARQLSAREIARMIGYAPGTLYNAFENLGDIVLRVEVKMLEELDGSLKQAVAGATGRKAIERYAVAYLAFAHERVRLWRLLNDHRPDGLNATPGWYADALGSVVAQLDEPLTRLMPDAGPSELAQEKRALWACIHGMAVNSTCEKMGYLTLEAATQHVRQLLDAYLAGLSARARGIRVDGPGCEHGRLA
jgi:AcrR family transcriptional regulator